MLCLYAANLALLFSSRAFATGTCNSCKRICEIADRAQFAAAAMALYANKAIVGQTSSASQQTEAIKAAMRRLRDVPSICWDKAQAAELVTPAEEDQIRAGEGGSNEEAMGTNECKGDCPIDGKNQAQADYCPQIFEAMLAHENDHVKACQAAWSQGEAVAKHLCHDAAQQAALEVKAYQIEIAKLAQALKKVNVQNKCGLKGSLFGRPTPEQMKAAEKAASDYYDLLRAAGRLAR
jgi:hypothetical protein